jgi:hypothetical protein
MCAGLYAEEESPQNDSAFPALPPLVFDIIYPNDSFTTKFLLLDGSYLDYGEMRERLLAIPGNEKYLNRAKGFEIGSFVGLGVGVAGGIAYIVFSLIPDVPNREIVKTAMWSTFILGSLGGAVSYTYSYRSLREATRNYNLSVMGIPIPANTR